jgi:acyl-CoA hydrolase
MEKKRARDSRVIKTSRIFPKHTNDHHTLFGGLLMSYIDEVASIFGFTSFKIGMRYRFYG